MTEPPLRVMLVDDHQVVRDGIKLLLSDTTDVNVMDVRHSDGSGIEATRDIRAARPQTSVLMLTSFADDEAKLEVARRAEAAAYLARHTTLPGSS